MLCWLLLAGDVANFYGASNSGKSPRMATQMGHYFSIARILAFIAIKRLIRMTMFANNCSALVFD